MDSDTDYDFEREAILEAEADSLNDVERAETTPLATDAEILHAATLSAKEIFAPCTGIFDERQKQLLLTLLMQGFLAGCMHQLRRVRSFNS